jgi:pimeloyl-ACP methyl ester carboxylesterase
MSSNLPQKSTVSSPRMVRANEADLCVQTFGEPTSPVLLLIAGAASSMDWWEDELCERLAAGDRFVIRYDLRDTGQSVTSEPGHPDYGGAELVADAAGVLDALRISRAHVVGISMGGGIGLRLALDYPERVASLTLLSSSPGPGGLDNDDLPPMSDELAGSFVNPPPAPDWSNRDEVIEYIVDSLGPFAGSLGVDEDGARALVGRIVDRTLDIESSMTNHWLLEGGEPTRPRLGSITQPTLVLHGTDDPLFPYAHGEALAAEIPGARLVQLEGVGHEFPPRQVWDQFVEAVLDHTRADRR